MSQVEIFIYLGAFLFAIGLMIIITRKNMIMTLIGIELMLNASNLNLVSFNTIHSSKIDGQMFALFVIIIAVCETAVGLALILRVYKYYQTSIPSEVSELKD